MAALRERMVFFESAAVNHRAANDALGKERERNAKLLGKLETLEAQTAAILAKIAPR